MKRGFELFSESEYEELVEKTEGSVLGCGDDDWMIDLLGCQFKKQDWDMKEFLVEAEKMKDDKKTFEEVAEFFWVSEKNKTNKTSESKNHLHNITLECKVENEKLWCLHEDCLESIYSFDNENHLNDHMKEKHTELNTIIVENIGEIIIPCRNTEEEIFKIIEKIKDDLDILYELFHFVEKY